MQRAIAQAQKVSTKIKFGDNIIYSNKGYDISPVRDPQTCKLKINKAMENLFINAKQSMKLNGKIQNLNFLILLVELPKINKK